MQFLTHFANQFLVALPALGESDFARSVIFICQHNEEGAMGLIINRLSDYCLGEVLGQMNLKSPLSRVSEAPVLIGGPVQPERGFVLHTPHGSWESSFKISETLSVTTSRDVVVAMAEGRGPQEALVALGYTGWGAGQLEQELKENAWLLTQASEKILFDTPIEHRWEGAARLLGAHIATLPNYVGNA